MLELLLGFFEFMESRQLNVGSLLGCLEVFCDIVVLQADDCVHCFDLEALVFGRLVRCTLSLELILGLVEVLFGLLELLFGLVEFLLRFPCIGAFSLIFLFQAPVSIFRLIELALHLAFSLQGSCLLHLRRLVKSLL